jgi:hypothetical protein
MLRARQQMFRHFMRLMAPQPETTLLDVGVTCDIAFEGSNYLEHAYPHKSRITCVGIEDGSHLEKQFPGLRFLRVEPGQRLPFEDKVFDIAYSNAVVEHVGCAANQRAFTTELCRVGKRVFLATPNRWFPVEHHTGIPFLHWAPKTLWRKVLRGTQFDFYSYESHLNLLTETEFRTLFPPELPVKTLKCGLGFGLFRSNLIACTPMNRL